MTGEPSAVGAYGFHIEGADDAAHLMMPVPDEWPTLTISQVTRVEAPVKQSLGDDGAIIPLLPAGSLLLSRVERSVEFRLAEPIGAEALVHPYLAPAAAVQASWLGRESYHAAGVVIDERVWGFAGDREAGKSTLVAALAARDHPIMADDLLVIDEDNALAGPRTIDLREEAARRLGGTRARGTTGMRERWRLDVGSAPVTAPFAGWVYPSWGGAIEVAGLALETRLSAPGEHRAVRHRQASPEHAMWMASLPGVTYVSPRRWEAMDESIDRLVAFLTT